MSTPTHPSPMSHGTMMAQGTTDGPVPKSPDPTAPNPGPPVIAPDPTPPVIAPEPGEDPDSPEESRRTTIVPDFGDGNPKKLQAEVRSDDQKQLRHDPDLGDFNGQKLPAEVPAD